jgi:hypothetical protein
MAATNVQAFSGDVEISSNLAVNTSDLFVDTVSGRVGIGMTDPTGFEVYNRPINQTYRDDYTNIHVNNKYQIDSRDTSAPNTLSQRYGVRAADNGGLNPEIGELIIGAHADQNYLSSDGTFISFNDASQFYIATHPTANYGEDVTLESNQSYPYIGADTNNRISPLFTVRSSGDVGIGTTNPLETLDVRGAIIAPVVPYGSNQDAPYLIAGTPGYTGEATSWNTHGFQHRIKSNSSGVPRITVDTAEAGEAFTIVQNGYVGIGKTNPNYPLDVAGAIRYSGTTYNTGILGGSTTPVKDQQQNSGTLTAGNWYRIAKNGPALDGQTGGSRCMARFTLTDVQTSEHSTRVFYAGSTFGRDPFFHLVANTSYDSPGVIEKIRLVDSEGSDSEGFAIDIYIHATAGPNAVQVVMDDNIQLNGFELVDFEANPSTTGMAVDEYNLTYLVWAVSPADSGSSAGMFVNQDGWVGIGTTNPQYKLHIEDYTNPRILIENTDTLLSLNQDIGSIVFKQNDNSSTGTGIIGKIRMSSVVAPPVATYYGESANMIFSVGNYANNNANIDALTIRGSGNVGIGSTNPGSLLVVSNGDVSVTNGSIYVSKSASYSRVMRLGVTSGGTGMNFYCGGTSGGVWAGTGIPMTVNNGGGGTILFVFNANRGAGDATNSQVFVLRKRYDGGSNWTQTSTTAKNLVYLEGAGGAGTLYFRQSGNYLQYKFDQGGNAHFYAIDCD